MKKLLSILSLLLSFVNVHAQQQMLTVDSIDIGRKPASKINLNGAVTFKNFNGKRPITGSVATGQNPNTNDLVSWLNAVFYPSQPPTASISGGLTYEFSGISATNSLSYSYGRLLATEPIASASINQGVGNVFSSQPSQGSSVSGSVTVTTPANVNTTYTITVTTTDGKNASASTSINWLPKKFWGRTSNTSANSTDLQNSFGGGNQLSNTKAGTYTITASGSNRVFIAYPSSFGDLTSINIGGLESLGAFTKTVISYTNINGYTQNYNIYTSVNATGGNVTAIAN